jgi:hypothetical protein
LSRPGGRLVLTITTTGLDPDAVTKDWTKLEDLNML